MVRFLNIKAIRYKGSIGNEGIDDYYFKINKINRKIYIVVVTTKTMDELIKQKIIELLDDTEKSTTELASLLNRNHYDVVEFLEEMEKLGIIEKIEISKFTFWKNKK